MYRSNQPYRGSRKIGKGIFFAILAILFLFFIGFVIQYLWNMILVEVTGVKPVSYWQAVGLFVLSRILFGGFRSHSGRKRSKKSKRWSGRQRREWREKWVHMTDEEKAEMKARWRDRCGK